MKCPKCKYTSFDNLTSCKKCGFVFKRNNDSESILSFESPDSEIDISNDEILQDEKSPGLSKTVASIRESLDEIDAGSTPQDQINRVESKSVQLGEAEKTVEGNDEFPTHGEINWEKSISSAELNLDILDLPEEEGGLKCEDDKPEIAYEKTEKFKNEMELIGEELKQVEVEPTKDEPAHLSNQSDTSYGLPTARRGRFWIRFSAFMIDNIILYFLAFILTAIGIIALGLGASGLEALEEEGIYSLMLPLYVFNTILTIAYYTYFHGSTGQTPGKMICKLKVVQLNGEPLGYGKAFLRWVGYIVSALPLYLGFLWAGWDKNKQAWHDKFV